MIDDCNEYSKMNYEQFWNNSLNIYECDMCDRTYMKRGSLYTHKKFECGKEPLFQCTICNFRFKLKGCYKRHLQHKHNMKFSKNNSFLF